VRQLSCTQVCEPPSDAIRADGELPGHTKSCAIDIFVWAPNVMSRVCRGQGDQVAAWVWARAAQAKGARAL
jgi:hypothetical protein